MEYGGMGGNTSRLWSKIIWLILRLLNANGSFIDLISNRESN